MAASRYDLTRGWLEWGTKSRTWLGLSELWERNRQFASPWLMCKFQLESEPRGVNTPEQLGGQFRTNSAYSLKPPARNQFWNCGSGFGEKFKIHQVRLQPTKLRITKQTGIRRNTNTERENTNHQEKTRIMEMEWNLPHRGHPLSPKWQSTWRGKTANLSTLKKMSTKR